MVFFGESMDDEHRQLDEADLRVIRRARGRFAAMVGTYGMGVFNDSFFRHSAILLTADKGEGWMMTLFAVPYLLLASTAGWLADRYGSRRLLIIYLAGCAAMALAAALAGSLPTLGLPIGRPQPPRRFPVPP